MFDKSLFNQRVCSFVVLLFLSLTILYGASYSYAQEEPTKIQSADEYLNSLKVDLNQTEASYPEVNAPIEGNINSQFFDDFFKKNEQEKSHPLDHNHTSKSILPFSPEVTFDNNIVNIKITISGNSYIYRPSLTLVIDPALTQYQEPQLPPATPHSDALGDSFVYFNEIKFSIPMIKARAGAILILHYQGCDESGICYPPQSFVISIPYDIDTHQAATPNDGYTQLDHNIATQDQSSKAQASEVDATTDANGIGNAKANAEANISSGQAVASAKERAPAPEHDKHDEAPHETVSYLSQANQEQEITNTGIFSFFTEGQSENSDAISQLLSNNLLIGLLICFLLGIGLDLTPCVLPMLPIFSAMIIGSKKTSIKTIDVLESSVENNDKKDNSKVRRFNFVLMQNLGFALGLALTYTLLGLLFSMAGAQLHSILQSAALNFVLAILMIICALACADVFVLKMPSFITNRLQRGTSKVNTSKFPGAFILGASAAIIASPCTSAPLAGALLYVMKNGDILMGTLVFFTIGLGMATPLFIIGMFGSKFLLKSGIVGDIIKRLMVVVLIGTAYIIVRHNLGRAEIFVGALTTYIISVYTLISIVFFIRRRALPMITATAILIVSLVPTYLSLGYYEQSQQQHTYEAFYSAQDLNTFNRLSANNYSFVVFTAQWCANCKIMEKEIYSTEHFVNSSMEFRKILVNITDTNDPDVQEIINKYQVIGVPFFITLDDEGQVVQSRLGLASTKTVYEALDKLRKLSNQEP